MPINLNRNFFWAGLFVLVATSCSFSTPASLLAAGIVDGSNTPDTTFSKLYAWYDGGSYNGVVWDNLQGVATRDLTSSSGGKPTVLGGAINGLPAADFDGGDRIFRGVGDWGSLGQPNTVIVVANVNADTDGYIFDGATTPQRNALFAGSSNNPTGWSQFSNGAQLLGTPFNLNTWETHSTVFNGNSSGHLIDGSLAYFGNAGTGNLGGLILGARVNQANRLDGQIAEVLVFNGSLTAGERKSIEQYLSNRYALPTNADQRVLQWGFDHTSGSVSSFNDGAGTGVIIDDSGNLNHAVVQFNNPTYSSDQPLASQLDNPAGTGSLNLSTGHHSIRSENDIVTNADLLNHGGLMLETWVRSPGNDSTGHVISMEGNLVIQSTGSGYQFFIASSGGPDVISGAVDKTQWNHVAAIISNTTDAGGNVDGTMELFINGRLAAIQDITNPINLDGLTRPTALGSHATNGSGGFRFDGLFFDPQITLSAFDELYSDNNGDWGTGINWDGDIVPTATRDAFVGNGNTITVTQAGEVADNLTVGHADPTLPGAGTLNVNSGDLTVSTLTVGDGNTGSVNVGGGDLIINGSTDVRDGSITATSGSVSGGNLTIQGGSTYSAEGTSTSDFNIVAVGQSLGSGTLNVQDSAIFNANRLDVGNPFGISGAVTQSGGEVNLAGANVGSTSVAMRLGHWPAETSTYDMSGGVLNADANVYIGWDGIGLMTLSNDADVNVDTTLIVQRNSTLTIEDDATVNANFFSIGDQRGVGNVDQDGGTVTITGGNGVRVGHWPAGAGSDYDMSSGQLITPTLAVGWDGGNSTMQVTGDADVDVAGTLIVQRNSTLTISDDSTVNANFFSIGDQRGNGHVDQDGGTVTITGANGVRLGHWPAGTGSTYDMSGGQLITPTLAVGWDGSNNRMDVFGNANVDVAGDLLVQRDSTLNVYGSSTVDANFISIGDDRGAGTMNIGGSAVVTAPDVTVGRTSQGNLNQTGGTLNVTAATTYQVGGGSLGLVAHSGGTANVTGNLNIGTDGTAGDTYTLSNSAVLNFGDTAAVTQVLGPTPSVMTVGPDGDFNFQGGTLINVETINVDPSNSPFTVGDLTVAGGADPTGPARFVIGVDGGLDPNNPATTRAYTTISDGGGTNPDGSPLGTPIDFVLNEDGTLVVDVFGFGSHGINGEQGGTLAINPLDPALDSDILHVTGDATLNGLLEVDPNGLELFPFAWYDVMLASGEIDASGLDIDGLSLFRVVDNPFGAGQILQVAVPEPASIAIWTLIGLALAGFGWIRIRRKG